MFTAMAYGSGYLVNFADIVPAYSSIIFSAASTVATIGALFSNIIAGFVIKRPVLEDWRKIFILLAVFHMFGGLVFAFFGSGVPRKWATFKPEKEDAKTVEVEAERVEMLEETRREQEEMPSKSEENPSTSR